MVVGDDAQSIYSWRGANFGNMLEFPERYKAVTYYMEENYRSSPEILEAANQSINYNTRQFEKTSLVHCLKEKNLSYIMYGPLKMKQTWFCKVFSVTGIRKFH